jgi:hypothetical protein
MTEPINVSYASWGGEFVRHKDYQAVVAERDSYASLYIKQCDIYNEMHVANEALTAERDKLNDAVWQALDDMRSGQSVCLATKKMLVDAYIRDSDPANWPVGLGETLDMDRAISTTETRAKHAAKAGETEIHDGVVWNPSKRCYELKE